MIFVDSVLGQQERIGVAGKFIIIIVLHIYDAPSSLGFPFNK